MFVNVTEYNPKYNIYETKSVWKDYSALEKLAFNGIDNSAESSAAPPLDKEATEIDKEIVADFTKPIKKKKKKECG